jgi:hypothetical protein
MKKISYFTSGCTRVSGFVCPDCICRFYGFRGSDFLRFLIAIPGPAMTPVQEPLIAHPADETCGISPVEAAQQITAYAIKGRGKIKKQPATPYNPRHSLLSSDIGKLPLFKKVKIYFYVCKRLRICRSDIPSMIAICFWVLPPAYKTFASSARLAALVDLTSWDFLLPYRARRWHQSKNPSSLMRRITH